jgi:MFS family permease
MKKGLSLLDPQKDLKTVRNAHFIFAIILLAYFMSYFFRIAPAVVMPLYAAPLGLSAAMTGFIASFYFYAYGAMQPVCGVLLDKFGPMRVASAGLFITALGGFMMVFKPTVFTLSLWRLLMGLGFSPLFMGALVFQAAAFPLTLYAFYSGITLATGNMGTVVGVAPLGTAIDTWGMPAVSTFLAIFCLFLSSLLFLKRKDDPVYSKERSLSHSLLQNFKEAFRFVTGSPVGRSISLLWSLSMASILSLQALWAVSWFAAVYERPFADCRGWASFIGVGVVIGTLLSGFLGRSEKIRNFLLYAFSAVFSLSLALITGLLFFHFPIYLAASAGFILGMCTGGGAVCYAAKINEVAPSHLRGAVMGVVNTFIYLSVIIYQWGTGAILDFFPGGVPGYYAKEGYAMAYVIVFGVSTLVFYALWVLHRHKGER